ncbi:MAG: 2-amino-4-hydroxy-6-hydroxymethyldihydropteridine diphosphokinase [Acidobacteriaceae bacterium]|nr:2-amino-4-hydroxy-6-hydroxymethyldihydropteridine diphosphokinase [Acidobacteriaceae bacterium]
MRAAIALGSNLSSAYGDPSATVREAMLQLRTLGTVQAVSSLYRTAPVGYVDQPDFVNAAAVLETDLSALPLLRALLALEQNFGRDRTAGPAKGPRTLDLDLLLYGQQVLAEPELILPHPAMRERRFVLEPLAEIAPEWMYPGSDRSVAELLAALP